MKKHLTLVSIVLGVLYLLSSCNNKVPITGADISAPVINIEKAKYTAEGLAHEPYGRDQLYGNKEAPVIWWERAPRDPQEDETVILAAALWRQDCPIIKVSYSVNGKVQIPIMMVKKAILTDNGLQKQKYIAEIGNFKQGDKIEYIISAGNEDEDKVQLGPFSFTVTKWETVEHILGVDTAENSTQIMLKTLSLTPTLLLSANEDKSIKFNLTPLAVSNKEISNYEKADISLGKLKLSFTTKPLEFSIRDENDRLIASFSNEAIQILTDKENVFGARINVKVNPQDEFYGFGMKYNSLNQRNKNVDTYCVNWYTDQNKETYTPVPFYFVPNEYGLFVNSTYYSRFKIDTEVKDTCSIDISCQNDDIEFHLFVGNNEEISNAYTNIAGKPVLPPVWAFGPWISANEWNKQSEIIEQLEQTKTHEIPTSVIVIEAWSDEETFYTFNDSKFNLQDGSYVPSLSDFAFGGRWPDPKDMVDKIHDAGAKVLLWQIPVLKASANETPQSVKDKAYAKEKGYVLSDKNNNAYQIPHNTWFGGSLLIDFTNKEASNWFLSKRKYLLEDIGIDGFKTDGGEFVWGRDVTSSSGMKGNELRNLYPDLYAQSFFDYSRQFVPDALTFSRAGGASMQSHPIAWVGDQKSTQKAFEEAIRATLSASMSGIPFVAWDTAGFSGDVPTSELYQRAVAQAAFSPIMQVHSETSGDPQPSQARTPWNMAQRKGSDDCIETYRYFANVRMNLMPYIYTEASHSATTGEPLMRSMAYSFPKDKLASQYEFQYMFGRNLLVAPMLDISKKNLKVYLPKGKWYNLFSGQEYEGGEHNIEVPLNSIPVFVREGYAVPMNLGSDMNLGSFVGNDVLKYDNLVAMCYSDNGSYSFYDYVKNETIEISIEGKGIHKLNGR